MSKSNIDPKDTEIIGYKDPAKGATLIAGGANNTGVDDTSRLNPKPNGFGSPSSNGSSYLSGSGPSTTGGTTGTTTTSSYSNSAYSFTSTPKMEPTLAFEAHGIEFWGSAKDCLDAVDLQKNDLIVNCSGYAYQTKPFVKEKPKWLRLPDKSVDCQQAVLDWPDFKTPPTHIGIEFWTELVAQARKNGIERIFCCCAGGQGRTGTALASLCLATGVLDDPLDAIHYVRELYSDHAIETDGQMKYVLGLVWDYQTIADIYAKAKAKKEEEEKAKQALVKTSVDTQKKGSYETYVGKNNSADAKRDQYIDKKWHEWLEGDDPTDEYKNAY